MYFYECDVGFLSIAMLVGLSVVVVLCCFVLFSWGRLIVVVIAGDVGVQR